VFESWRNQVQLESGQKLKAIRSDNAPEFIKLSKELEKDGIRIELTVPYTPSQNGVAERLNRTLITKARAMLVAAELPSQLWGEAVHVACQHALTVDPGRGGDDLRKHRDQEVYANRKWLR
jgi:transposase InsO family protein